MICRPVVAKSGQLMPSHDSTCQLINVAKNRLGIKARSTKGRTSGRQRKERSRTILIIGLHGFHDSETIPAGPHCAVFFSFCQTNRIFCFRSRDLIGSVACFGLAEWMGFWLLRDDGATWSRLSHEIFNFGMTKLR